MGKRLTLIVVGIVFGFLNSHGASGPTSGASFSRIEGKVTDNNKNRNKILPGVKAYLFGDTILVDSTVVSESGEFKFDNLLEGTYDIVIKGNNYFPVKINQTKIKKTSMTGLERVPQLLVLSERYKQNAIFDDIMYVRFKPIITEAEIDRRITQVYGYQLETVKSLNGGVKFYKLTLPEGDEVITCSVFIPHGQTLTSVANELIMEPYVFKVEPVIALRFWAPNLSEDR